ncbi:hypothetical protein LB505_011559 [Fusarium chuoi]|nr:hypothetical protein LB505_011559 [Fusarium chuoi]
MTIRSMHAVGSGAADAVRKIKALGISFIIALLIICVGQYADGILHNWHIFTWFYVWSGYTASGLLEPENWAHSRLLRLRHSRRPQRCYLLVRWYCSRLGSYRSSSRSLW